LPGYYVLLVNEERIVGFDLKMNDEDKKGEHLSIRKPKKEKSVSRNFEVLPPGKSFKSGDDSVKINEKSMLIEEDKNDEGIDQELAMMTKTKSENVKPNLLG
jgi:hypothetical protein